MKKNIFLTAVFLLILALPTIDLFFHFSPVKDLFEKRLPVPKPAFPKDFAELKSYPRNFDKFFDDNYGFRKSFVSANSVMMDKLFNESPDARAVIGKEGWFFFDNHNSLLDAAGRASIDDKMVEKAVESFYENWQKMHKKNINYLAVIVADKSTVYPEFLPSYIKPSQPHRIDKFINAMKKKHPDFPILDLRPILLKAKEKEIIYHKTDTHWNARGAHYAYAEIMKKLGIKPHSRSDFTNKEDGFFHGDISDIMGIKDENIDYNLSEKFKLKSRISNVSDSEKKQFHKPIAYVNENGDLPRLFAYKDSFFANLSGLVSEHFSYAFYVNEFPCDINYETIKKYHPNVVIQEFWEGRIEVIFKECK